MAIFGTAIRNRRQALGFARQYDLAEASRLLVGEDPNSYSRFSQQWLSRLEADETGEIIGAADRPKLRTLLQLLDWNEEDFQREVGVSAVVISPDFAVRVRNQGVVTLGTEEAGRSLSDLRDLVATYAERLSQSRTSTAFLIVYFDNSLVQAVGEIKARIPEGARLLVEVVEEPHESGITLSWSDKEACGYLRTVGEKKPAGIRHIRPSDEEIANLKHIGVVRQVTYDL